jgi:hypothetical protein
MHRRLLVAWLFGLVAALPVSAQERASCGNALPNYPDQLAGSAAAPASAPQPPAPTAEQVVPAEPPAWDTVWGVFGIRVFAAGPKEAPNGQEYHPSFSIDLDFNVWVWRCQGLYLFGDVRFWNERPEYGVTNAKDSGLGFSKRQFDLVGGPAWNYYGPLEARLYGYTFNNLNRGVDLVKPVGLNDGFGMENRLYLSEEYENLGRAGFDVARADFVAIGYYLTKDMVGTDGRMFNPGLMLRAYLTYDLGDWPVYVFGDVTFLTERSMHPKLVLLDAGLAAQPFRDWTTYTALKTWEFRVGVENTGDLELGNVQNLWYGSVRVLF